MKYTLAIIACFMLSSSIYGQTFTLEEIMGQPYAYELATSAEFNRIAWVVNEKGARNIWMAESPDFNPVRLTNFSGDDGQEISDLQFTKNGATLIFVRGNGPNRNGELANPASFGEKVSQGIFKLDLKAGGDPIFIANGSSPLLSPNGNKLLFSNGGIQEVAITGNTFSPKRLFSARGSSGGPVYSPDGGKVAFVSNRGDHSFVGVFEPNDERICWMAPGVDRDMHPVWSPDGNQIAFIRMPGIRKDELNNIMSGQPFSIVVVNVATGIGRVVWSAPNTLAGGFAQYYPDQPLFWRNNRLLFYSEHEGWMHIYSLHPDGGQPVDLTPGACEAEHASVSPDGQTLYFTSNCGDPERRHMWAVPTAGGTAAIMTPGTGIETDVKSMGDNRYVAMRWSTAKTTSGIKVWNTLTKEEKTVFPKSTKVLGGQVVPKTVVFKAADGLEIRGQVFVPKNEDNNKRPALIFMHGGPIRQMLEGYHYSSYYANAYAMNQYLCQQGYVVLSVNYRCGIGYGRDFRLAENQGPRGASEYQDILAAARYLQGREDVDGAKIGLWGGSYGGYLTAMGLARNSDIFAAGVDLHGVHDWAWRGRDFSPGGAWGIGPEDMQLAYESSPVHDVAQWKSPVLLVHGDDDRNVMFGQTVDLAQRLRDRNVPTEILVLPDEVHGFLRYESWLRTFEEGVRFFDKWLK